MKGTSFIYALLSIFGAQLRLWAGSINLRVTAITINMLVSVSSSINAP